MKPIIEVMETNHSIVVYADGERIHIVPLAVGELINGERGLLAHRFVEGERVEILIEERQLQGYAKGLHLLPGPKVEYEHHFVRVDHVANFTKSTKKEKAEQVGIYSAFR